MINMMSLQNRCHTKFDEEVKIKGLFWILGKLYAESWSYINGYPGLAELTGIPFS